MFYLAHEQVLLRSAAHDRTLHDRGHDPFTNRSFDLVFLGHVLHETDDALTALKEARRVIRSRVAILEWPYRQEEKGPPLEHRLKPEFVADPARQAGFQRVEILHPEHMDFYRLTP